MVSSLILPLLILGIVVIAGLVALGVFRLPRLKKILPLAVVSFRLPLSFIESKPVHPSSVEHVRTLLEHLRPFLTANWNTWLYGKPHFALEVSVPADRDGVYFSLAIPPRAELVLTKWLEAHYPLADRVSISAAPAESLAGGYFSPRPDASPTVTASSLNGLLKALAQLQPVGESAHVQILAQPTGLSGTYAVNLRCLASAPTPLRAEKLNADICRALGQATAAGFTSLSGPSLRSFFDRSRLRHFDPSAVLHLSADELATLYHFPSHVH